MRNVLKEAVGDPFPRLIARAALSLGLAGLFLWLLATRLTEVDPAEVGLALSGMHWLQWGLAVAATAVSFWAVGHYDAVVHRYFDTGVPSGVARRAGVSAIAVSQMLGLGVVTGAVLRWRMLPGQSWGMAIRLTIAVALSFLAGWAVVTALLLLVLPGAPFRGAAVVVVVLAVGSGALAVAWPHRLRRWPNLFIQTRLVGLAGVDTIAAALALYVLLPAELGLTVVTLLPAFLIAQGAGLVSGAPGGVGAFEVTLLALLPPVSPEPLLAAVLAWRMIYYALPAALGGIVAAIGPKSTIPVPPGPRLIPIRAEIQIEAQGEHHRLVNGDWLAGRTRHLLVGLFDPLVQPRSALQGLTTAATNSDRWPAIYKCSGRTAAVARSAGWQVLGIAREAWLDPRNFRLAASSCAGLRRKLRRAAAAGVRTGHQTVLPLREMTRIAAHWATEHGGERGFAMGRFAPGYVALQRVYLAHCNGRLVAFATFHQGRAEWTLDLLRYGPDTPDGTMHALVAAAIEDAARLGLPRLSLAAIPEAAFGRNSKIDRAMRHLGADGAGLLQFKAAFAPRWQPLYLAAPHQAALVLAGCEIACAIANPPALPVSEQDHAEYEFASAPHPWQRQAR